MLNRYDVDPSWRVIVLDYDEWWTYNESRNHFNKYKDEFIEKGDWLKSMIMK